MSDQIKSNFLGWDIVAENLKRISNESKKDQWLNEGQQKSILAIAKNIPNNGMIIADEVGMGKTRIAVAVAKAVTEAQGRVAILIPPGLGYQWKEELKTGKLTDIPDPLRSLNGYFDEKNSKLFIKSILLISHLFSNWQHRENSRSWRFALLPEMYACLRNEKKRLPRNYFEWSDMYSPNEIKLKAQEIIDAIPQSKTNPARKKLTGLNNLQWSEELFQGKNYINLGGEELRGHLKSCVGLGLGIFDLIIIDEAHKNRGTDSGLSKMLKEIICRDENHRVLGLTATPVELELEDWINTLRRIGINEEECSIKECITKYATAVNKVRESWKVNEIDRECFKSSARIFERALKKYLLRRDKREDPAVIEFKEKSNLPYYQYRKEKEILIDPLHTDFPDSWRKAICGAEALSFASAMKVDPWAKRFRLTLANGHGLSTWLDVLSAEPESDEEDIASISGMINTEEQGDDEKDHMQKKKDRIAFWKETILKSVPQKKAQLFHHPAILAAIKCIEEEYTKYNNKVLVFGKFTRPMKTMVSLLNAREMIRRLDVGRSWPQYTLRKDEELAVKIALDQLSTGLKKKWNINRIRDALKKNEYKIEASRKKFRKDFFQFLREGAKQKQINRSAISFQLFEFIEKNSKKYEEVFIHLTRACYELIFGSELVENENPAPGELWDKYQELVHATRDFDFGDEEISQDLGDEKIENILDTFNVQLKEEFGTQSARFARLMFGETKHHSRRLMQLAFNRPGSFPYVLVAQSKVGREGLNLHKACKTVIMLHPEWNPAVAEQQIGRVDRLGSIWSQMINDYSGEGEDIPQIEIRPVIFKNTYDEQNWNVLRERWDDLRAQLHGIIIPDRDDTGFSSEDKEIIRDLNNNAPGFAP